MTFYGGTFLDKQELEEVGIKYPIKIEYYKQINESYISCDNEAKFGIYMIKTEYRPDNIKVQTKSIRSVTNDEVEEDRILNIFKENKVTLINSEEVISDLFRNKF